ncbi:MAG: YdeI/OmpD-associated family protein, partial [Cyanobacteria bacterium J06623_7]
DDVEALILPDDLKLAFEDNAIAFHYWEQFPPSVKRGILEWIKNAKRPVTRNKRITETVSKAAQNIRANY